MVFNSPQGFENKSFFLNPKSSVISALEDRNWKILITGASGWLGQATLSYLGFVFKDKLPDRVSCFGSVSKKLNIGGYSILQKPMSSLSDTAITSDTLLCHFAFLTKDRVSLMSKDDYVSESSHIRNSVLNAIGNTSLAGLFVPSSGAVYDAMIEGNRDPDANLYGKLKMADEEIFTKTASSGGYTFVCPRIFNLSGPYINKFSSYALASFINDCLQQKPIHINSVIPVWRSYLFIGDLLDLVFRILMGEPYGTQVIFDTAGDQVIEISELAEMVINRCGSPSQQVLRPSLDRSRENRYIGNPDLQKKLQSKLGLSSLPLPIQVDETARYIRTVCPT